MVFKLKKKFKGVLMRVSEVFFREFPGRWIRGVSAIQEISEDVWRASRLSVEFQGYSEDFQRVQESLHGRRGLLGGFGGFQVCYRGHEGVSRGFSKAFQEVSDDFWRVSEALYGSFLEHFRKIQMIISGYQWRFRRFRIVTGGPKAFHGVIGGISGRFKKCSVGFGFDTAESSGISEGLRGVEGGSRRFQRHFGRFRTVSAALQGVLRELQGAYSFC